MNIYDISKRAGVSIATVSRVLNGSEKVSEKTKQRVLEVMNETDYTPNVFARGLGLNSMKTIGIMCPDSSDAYLANGVYYAEQNFRNYGYDTLLSCSGYQLENKKKALKLLMSKRVDAIIMIGSSYVELNEADLDYIREAAKEVPIAIVNGCIEGKNIYCSYCDDYHATFDVTTSLLEKGRKNILYLYWANSYSGRQKMEGYKAALRAKGIEPREEYMVLVENSIARGREKLHELAEAGLEFDSVLSGEDAFAVSAVKYAKDKGLNIPEDIDIIGYNNSILSECSEPELTSIDSKVKTTTTFAVKVLIDVLSGREAAQKICTPCDIVKRGTTDF